MRVAIKASVYSDIR